MYKHPHRKKARQPVERYIIQAVKHGKHLFISPDHGLAEAIFRAAHVIGCNFPGFDRNFSAGDENLKVLKVILIRDTILNTVDVVGKIIGILYYHIKDLEFNINLLLPREDYEWNRNLTLTERMSQSLDVINNYEQYRIDELISHLYRVLSYIDEAVDTIEYYNERKEMLLNYPVFQKKITRILEQKGEVKLDELGVSEKYGREYLKMYLRTTYSPLMLEETADSLRRSS